MFFPTLYELAIAVAGCTLFGLISVASVALARRKHAMPSPTDAEPPKTPEPRTSSGRSIVMLTGPIRREFNAQPGPNQRMELLRLIRELCRELHAVASQELHEKTQP